MRNGGSGGGGIKLASPNANIVGQPVYSSNKSIDRTMLVSWNSDTTTTTTEEHNTIQGEVN